MIRENVPADEADRLVAQGGRVLYRRPSPSGESVVCDVELPNGDAEPAAEPDAPKRRGRPRKAEADEET